MFFLKTFKYLFSLKELQREQVETEGEIFHPLLHSSNGYNGPNWVDLKLGASSISNRSPTWVYMPKALGHPLLVFQVINRELDQKWGIWNMKGVHSGYQCHRQRNGLPWHFSSPLSNVFTLLIIYTLVSFPIFISKYCYLIYSLTDTSL